MKFSKDYINKLKSEITYDESLMALTEATIELEEEQGKNQRALKYIERCKNAGLLFSNIVYNELMSILKGDDKPWLK